MSKLNHNLLFDGHKIDSCLPDCKFRQPKCQSYCRVYLLAKEERDKEKEKIRNERNRMRILDTKPKPDRKR